MPIDGVTNVVSVPAAEAGSISIGSLGSVITVNVTATNIDEVLAARFNRVVLERSTDAGVTWAEVGQPEERPVLEPGLTTYKVIDRHGSTSYEYRTRYLNTTLPTTDASRCSSPSKAVTGAGIAAANVLKVSELQDRYLFGLKLTNDKGEPLPDATYQHYILAAVRNIEREIGIPLISQSFCEMHDYHPEDRGNYSLLQLDNYPVQSVDLFRVEYPTGQNVVVFPPEWLRLDKSAGHLQIVPTAGTLSSYLIATGGAALHHSFGGYIPQLFRVEYVAGFADCQIPRDIIDLIGKQASMGMFNIFGDLIAGAGIATVSLSMDGLSQNIGTTSSATNAGYGARIGQYAKDIKAALPLLRAYYRRTTSMVIA